MFKVPEKFRVKVHNNALFNTTEADGNNGLFIIPNGNNVLWCIVSDGGGWNHVSIHVGDNKMQYKRCPTWEEMCYAKDVFWDKEDCVVQFHPPKSDYVNVHPYTLHLWQPVGVEIPRPPKEFVG